MQQILHIIFYKILAFIKPEMDFSLRGVVKSVGSTVVYAGFATGAFIVALRALDFLLIEQRIGLFLLTRFISIILFIFFLSVNVGNIVVSYSTLFRSPEVAFLLTKPINPVRIFVIKFFDNFFYSSGTLLMVLVALLTGFTWYFKINVFYSLILFFFNFLPFMLTAGLLGVLLLLLLINTTLKFGFRKVVSVLALSYVAIIILFFQFSSPMDTVNGVMKYFPNVDGYFANLIPAYIKFLPNNWLAESMFWMAKGEIQQAVPYMVLQVSLVSVLLIIVVLVGKSNYLKTWHKSIDFQENTRKKTEGSKVFSFEKPSIFKNPLTDVMLKRDFHLFLREPAQIIHFLVLFFLILVFVSSLPGLSMMASKRVVLFTFVFLAVYIFNIFFIITISLRYVFPLVSMEGNVIWKIKSAPIDTKKLLNRRLSTPMLVIMLLSQFMSIFIVGRFSAHLIIPMSVVSFASTFFIAMMSFGMGGLFINLKEKNPVRLSSSQGASISFLFSMIYLVILIVLLFIPLSDFFTGYLRHRIYETAAVYKISAIILIISLIGGFLFYTIGVRSLEKDV